MTAPHATDKLVGPSAESCPGAVGMESPAHVFIGIAKSSHRSAPYLMCTKCGAILEADNA